VFRFQTEPLLCCCIIFSSAFCPAVGLPVACADGCLPAGCSLADGGNSLGDACSALALSLRSAASPAQREERPPKRASVQCKDSKGCPARPQPERASPAAIARPRRSRGELSLTQGGRRAVPVACRCCVALSVEPCRPQHSWTSLPGRCNRTFNKAESRI